jgi:hypothetical protein
MDRDWMRENLQQFSDLAFHYGRSLDRGDVHGDQLSAFMKFPS